MSDAIKCDGCGMYADRPQPWGGYQSANGERLHAWHNVPAGWVSLSARLHPADFMAATVSDSEGTFCGWSCAASWFSGYAQSKASA